MQQKQNAIASEFQTSVTTPQLTLTDDASPDSGRSEELSGTSSSGEDEDSKHASMTAAERLAEKRRMKRFRLTHSQTRFLMSEFSRQPHPDSARRERLSQDIPGLSPRQVQVWFQNRRAKMKRLTGDDQEHMTKSRALPAGYDLSAMHPVSLRRQRLQQSPSALPHFTGPGTSLLNRHTNSRASSRHATRPQISPVDTGLAQRPSPISSNHATWSPNASSTSFLRNDTLHSAEVSPQFPALSTSPLPQSADCFPSYVYGNTVTYQSSYIRSRTNSLMTSSSSSPLPNSQQFTYGGRNDSNEVVPTTYQNAQDGGRLARPSFPASPQDMMGANYGFHPPSYGWEQISRSQLSPTASRFHAQAAPDIQQQYGVLGWLSPTTLDDPSQLGSHHPPEQLQQQKALQTQSLDENSTLTTSQDTWYPQLLDVQPEPQLSLSSVPHSAPLPTASHHPPYFTSPMP